MASYLSRLCFAAFKWANNLKMNTDSHLNTDKQPYLYVMIIATNICNTWHDCFLSFTQL